MEGYKSYNQYYYQTKYKDIIKDKVCHCDLCNVDFSAWNKSKHIKSKKHIFNALPEEEKLVAIKEKKITSLNKKIEQLKKKVEEY